MANKISRKKVFHIIIAILVAFAVWLYVDMDKGVRVTAAIDDLQVEFLNEEALAQNGLMLLEDSQTTIDLRLEATRINISNLDRSKVRAQADLGTITETGEQTLNCTILYPEKINGERFAPNELISKNAGAYTITVNVGELSRKNVEVRCKLDGNVAQGYTAEKPVLEPAVLEIRGQEEDIQDVAYAQVVLKIDDATETVSEELDYEFYNSNGEKLENVGIHPTVDDVKVTLPVNVTKKLKLTMNFVEAPGAALSNVSWDIQPKTITVSGDAAKLAEVETISLGSFDLASMGSGTSYVYDIKLPEGCENLSGITRATLRIAFKDMKTARLNAVDFTYTDTLPDGKEAQILTQELPVTIFGTSADVATVSAEDILVTADLSDFGSAAGSYSVPARITVDTDKNIGVAGSYQVRVVIIEQQGDESE